MNTWMLAVNNGLLDLDTKVLHPHTPNWFSTSKLPYDYVPGKTSQDWIDYLVDKFDGNQEKYDLWQMFCGSLLTPRSGDQTSLWLIGEGSTGKSTIAQVAIQLVGEDNTSTVDLEDWDTPYGMTTMMGKMLNFSDEVPRLSAKVERKIKWYLGGTPLTINIKYRDPTTLRPTAKILCASNTWPRFKDKTDGIWRRVFVLPMDKVTLRKDAQVELWKKFCTAQELPGVLNWAIEGYEKLKAAGWKLPTCSEGESFKSLFRQEAHSHKDWITDCLAAGTDDNFLTGDEIMRSYSEWCNDLRYETKADSSSMYLAIARAFPQSERKRRRVAGSNCHGVAGIKFKENK